MQIFFREEHLETEKRNLPTAFVTDCFHNTFLSKLKVKSLRKNPSFTKRHIYESTDTLRRLNQAYIHYG